MIWLESSRIPPGSWPFLSTVRAGLSELSIALAHTVDMSEGTEHLLVSGCIAAYRQAVVRRTIDLAQGAICCWNADQQLAAIVCGRSLLETVAIFHSFLSRAEVLAQRADWTALSRMIDAFAWSSTSGIKKQKSPDDPERIGVIVRRFIGATNPGAEQFWHQISDTAHPNGRRMMQLAGKIRGHHFLPCDSAENAAQNFRAVYNCLYSCCWLIASDLDFDVLVERVRAGEPLKPNHPLIVRRDTVDRMTARLVGKLKSKRS